MLIAMFILIIALVAVMLVSFGNQSLLVDSQTDGEALNQAQGLLEKEQALARQDFKLVVPTSAVVTLPGSNLPYTETVAVATQPDFFTKDVTATVTWPGDHNRTEHVSLSAVVTNFNNAVGGDTCDSVIGSSEDWTHPKTVNATTDFGQLIGDTVNTYPITDLDAYQGRLYVTVGGTVNKTDPTFFVFNTSNPANPQLLGKIDNNTSAATGGLNAVAVATSTTQSYAYVASGYAPNFSTCTQGTNCAQLQIINISNPSNLSITNYKIPNVTGTTGVGNSIFYSNGYIYLGLASTGGNGPEFQVIDVHNPTSPAQAGFWPPTGSMGAGINAIYVKDGYAYLAHPASAAYNEQVTVLDISNPASPKRVAGFYYNGSSGGNGKTLDLVGNNLYLGRTASNISGSPDSIPEFYILDDTNPTALPATFLGSLPLTTTGDSINQVIVRDFLTFFVTNSQLQIWRTDNPSNLTSYAAPVTLPYSGSSYEPSMDCEGNYLYISSNNASNKGALSVITSGP